jgi:hypothetical protein
MTNDQKTALDLLEWVLKAEVQTDPTNEKKVKDLQTIYKLKKENEKRNNLPTGN